MSQKTLRPVLVGSPLQSVMPPTVEKPGSHQLPIHRSPKPTRGGFSSLGHGPHRPSLLRNSSTPAVESSQLEVVLTSPSQIKTQSRNSQFSGYVSDSAGPASEASSTSTPRRGRPPKILATAPRTPLESSTKKRGRPFKNPQETDTTTIVPKKRGRPFKTVEAADAVELTTSDLTQKKRGRPAKVPLDLVFLPPPKPIFHPFLCEWRDCPAELHNMDTLRNHIFNIHNKQLSSGRYTCLWGSCGATRKVIDEVTRTPKVVVINFQFKTMKELHDHIEKSHMVPLAWHMGDGPKGTSLEATKKSMPEVSAPWLYDTNGKQVTPSVDDIPIEPGHPRENNIKRFTKQREGLYVVLVPIEPPEAVQKRYSNGDTPANGIQGMNGER